MAQFGEDIPKPTGQDGLNSLDFMNWEKENEVPEDSLTTLDSQTMDHSLEAQDGSLQWDPFTPWEPGAFGAGMGGDDWPLNDTLYGLFTPDQPMY